MIIGRENELKTLKNIFKKNKFECLIMYGRRRVGKTTLINEFVKCFELNTNDLRKYLHMSVLVKFSGH